MMQLYEYTVIPAPGRGEKVRGARTGAERFSYAMLTELNRMAAQGWEYVRAETLPCEERSGLTSRTTVYHNVLVFRRALAQAHGGDRPLAASQDVPTSRSAPRPQPLPDQQPGHHPAPAPAAPTVPPILPPTSATTASPEASPTGGTAQHAATPPSDWPDAGAPPADGTDSYRDPAAAAPGDAAPPPFTRRPPLAAPQDEGPRPVFGGGLSGPRLGPAER